MTRKIKNQTNSFSIAQYILLFAVVVLCIALVAWRITSARGTKPDNIAPEKCATRVTENITKMWTEAPDTVPAKYWTMVSEYTNQPVTVPTSGNCNGTAFSCAPGQIRRDCNPCAQLRATARARSAHIADVINETCGQ